MPNQFLSAKDIEDSSSATPPTPVQPGQLPPPQLAGTQLVPQEPKPKSYPPLKVVAAALGALVLVMLGGVIVYALTMQQKAPASVEQPAEQEKKVSLAPLTAEETIEHFKVYFKATEPATSSLSTPIKTEGSNYYTVITDPTEVKNTSLSSTLSAVEAESNLQALRKALSYDKFTETVLSDGTSSSDFLADYIRPDVVCQLRLVKGAEPSQPQHLEAKCLNSTQYENLARKQSTYFLAYSSASAQSVSSALIGAPVLSPSASKGYTLAEQQFGTVADFHSVSPTVVVRYYAAENNVWRYFSDEPGVIQCADYGKSPIVAVAYLGKPCLDSKNQQSTVKLRK